MQTIGAYCLTTFLQGLLDVADVLDFGDDNNRSSRDDNTGDVNNTSIGKPSNIRYYCITFFWMD